MRFEWDARKSRLNRDRHGILFEIAMQVFGDPLRLAIPDLTYDGEERFWTIGRLENLVLVVAVHTTRDEEGGEIVRIISARKAVPSEPRFYEEAYK
jgi:uncharacterized DUF497 family protein